MSESQVRLREPPEARFARPEDQFDLHAAARELAGEPESGQHGHRQKALIREGPMTLALYLFEAGSRLPNHVVDGVVLIQVLEGHLQVTTAAGTHDLPAGNVLRLSAGVQHDVIAVSSSQMLLTIALEGPGSHP